MLFGIDARDRQNGVALIDAAAGRSCTYRELSEWVDQRRAVLQGRARGLVFLFCRNDLESVAWYLAGIEAGHAVALLNGALHGGFQENLIARYCPDWTWGPRPPAGPGYRPAGADGLWRRDDGPGAAMHPELSLLLSTSGSTGSPKFVRLTRANVVANAESICEALGITAAERVAAHLPLHYAYGLSVVNSHLLAGATILLAEGGVMSTGFWEAIRRHRANSFSGVPYTYQMLRRLGLDELKVPELRTLTQAGGKLDNASIAHFHERMEARGGRFWTMYGQTEATARISILDPRELPERLGSAGKAIPGGRLSILANAGELTTATGVEGELVYEGPNVMMGYATGRGELGKGDELRGRLYTGDRAVLDSGGFVRILGRAGRDAKIFGLRMNLDEIEAMVRPSGPVAAIAAAGRIILYCEFGDGALYALLGQELSAKLRVHGSALEFRRIDRLPTRDSGKIAYEELQERP